MSGTSANSWSPLDAIAQLLSGTRAKRLVDLKREAVDLTREAVGHGLQALQEVYKGLSDLVHAWEWHVAQRLQHGVPLLDSLNSITDRAEDDKTTTGYWTVERASLLQEATNAASRSIAARQIPPNQPRTHQRRHSPSANYNTKINGAMDGEQEEPGLIGAPCRS
ncbi:hypothetical protein CONLIGDRAFT_686952 [Coniochaeta ligniaria NRRL 30616]|uniref:Uncharacterized protein n=1 Tax=Coniochaeta ligniaria NRRL 30616 TaxID=1408157 RepID=A0A1J7IQ00_9PEZI|nr:hypothetical protein CONLIGDRAFT_686952 [Coniochaeta ligniaria NRRL 30616]